MLVNQMIKDQKKFEEEKSMKTAMQQAKVQIGEQGTSSFSSFINRQPSIKPAPKS